MLNKNIENIMKLKRVHIQLKQKHHEAKTSKTS